MYQAQTKTDVQQGEPATIIKVVCQFCAAFIREKDGKGVSGTSHGICAKCLKLTEAEQMAVYNARKKK
jgi:hypothetical protein